MAIHNNSTNTYYKNINREFEPSLRDEVIISNKKAIKRTKNKILDLNKWNIEKKTGDKCGKYIFIENTSVNWDYRTIFASQNETVKQINNTEHCLITNLICLLRKKCKFEKVNITDILRIAFLKKTLFNVLNNYFIIRLILNIYTDTDTKKMELTILFNNSTKTLNIIYSHAISDEICFTNNSSIIPMYPLYNIEYIFMKHETKEDVYKTPALCVIPYTGIDIYNTTNIIMYDNVSSSLKYIKINLKSTALAPTVEIFLMNFDNELELNTSGEINTKIYLKVDSLSKLYKNYILIRLKNFRVGDILYSTEIFY